MPPAKASAIRRARLANRNQERPETLTGLRGFSNLCSRALPAPESFAHYEIISFRDGDGLLPGEPLTD